MIARSGCLNNFYLAVLVMAFALPVRAQTYTVQPGAAQKSQNKNSPHKSAQTSQPAPQLGFGSNIQNARLARAAEQALKRGDHALAINYAQRAARATPNDAHLWFFLGYAARLGGQIQLSISSYQHGLQLSPSSVEGRSGLAQAYSVAGQTSEAENLLKQILASNPNRRDDAMLLGNLYMKSGDYNGALGWLRKAEQTRPGARSELLLAMCFQRLNQMDQAKHYLNLAKQRAPNNPEVLRSLAGYYRNTGDYSQAIASLKSIPNPSPAILGEIAYTYQLSGQPEQSATYYAKAANAMPKDVNMQLSAAQAAVSAHSFDKAAPFLARAATLDPNYYRLHALRGQIAHLQERDDDAVREYQAALAHLPPTPAEGPLYGIQLHMDLMGLYTSLNDRDAARRQLQTAHAEIDALNEKGAPTAPFLRLRALIKMNEGNLDGAMADMKQAIALAPRDPSNLQIDGDLLMKLGRTEDAIAVYKKILDIDPRDRFALTSLGYASRAAGRDDQAAKYFELLAKYYPSLYVPYLAMGDMYTARHDFKRAQANYSKAYALEPSNALIVAGGMTAGIEAHDLNLAGTWLSRVKESMRGNPYVLRETERYLNFRGKYQESAEAGRKAIKLLPHDRDVVVYLGYDLLNLHKYDELLALTKEYNDQLPKEPDIPLLAGYAHKYYGHLEEARQAFSEVLQRDPKVETAYVNLGYVLNDLHQPQQAANNFEAALKLEPKDGQAHLGLAFSSLDLNKPDIALRESKLAEKLMGDSEPIHRIRATAYGREGLLTKAADEYRAALKFSPNDSSLHYGLGNTLFSERKYSDAIDELRTAGKLSPQNAGVYALMARA
ncbi:MAG: tetratricopeptide repeat protein, partial [Acidobacteriaceae bacterium]